MKDYLDKALKSNFTRQWKCIDVCAAQQQGTVIVYCLLLTTRTYKQKKACFFIFVDNADCGVFVAMFAWCLMYQIPIRLNALHSRSTRRHIALTLVKGTLHFRCQPQVN